MQISKGSTTSLSACPVSTNPSATSIYELSQVSIELVFSFNAQILILLFSESYILFYAKSNSF